MDYNPAPAKPQSLNAPNSALPACIGRIPGPLCRSSVQREGREVFDWLWIDAFPAKPPGLGRPARARRPAAEHKNGYLCQLPQMIPAKIVKIPSGTSMTVTTNGQSGASLFLTNRIYVNSVERYPESEIGDCFIKAFMYIRAHPPTQDKTNPRTTIKSV